jgi:hypothetical protein
METFSELSEWMHCTCVGDEAGFRTCRCFRSELIETCRFQVQNLKVSSLRWFDLDPYVRNQICLHGPPMDPWVHWRSEIEQSGNVTLYSAERCRLWHDIRQYRLPVTCDELLWAMLCLDSMLTHIIEKIPGSSANGNCECPVDQSSSGPISDAPAGRWGRCAVYDSL